VRSPSEWATRLHFFPVVTWCTSTAPIFRADFIVENFCAASRNGLAILRPSGAGMVSRMADLADFRDAQNFFRGGGKSQCRCTWGIGAPSRSAVDFRNSRFASPGAAPPWSRNSRVPPSFQHFRRFSCRFPRTKGCSRPWRRAAGRKRAKGNNTRCRKIRVVDVAVDLVGDDAGGRFFFRAHLVRGPCRCLRGHRIRAYPELVVFVSPKMFSLIPFSAINCSQDSLRTRMNDLANWGRSMPRPYNFTASAFVTTHSIGLAGGTLA